LVCVADMHVLQQGGKAVVPTAWPKPRRADRQSGWAECGPGLRLGRDQAGQDGSATRLRRRSTGSRAATARDVPLAGRVASAGAPGTERGARDRGLAGPPQWRAGSERQDRSSRGEKHQSYRSRPVLDSDSTRHVSPLGASPRNADLVQTGRHARKSPGSGSESPDDQGSFDAIGTAFLLYRLVASKLRRTMCGTTGRLEEHGTLAELPSALRSSAADGARQTTDAARAQWSMCRRGARHARTDELENPPQS
jgi:hypothetical protein